MRILVCPHDLAIGGSQINAIDLAAGVAAAGHEVSVYGIEGPLVEYVRKRGLRFISARRLRYRPAPSRIVQIAAIAARERLDLIHAYEWPPCLDAYYGAGLAVGVPLLCTLLSMSVAPYVPSSVPLIMGTADLASEARKAQRGQVWTLEPPIDTERDHPGIDGYGFRQRLGVLPAERLVVTVSRLALDLKLDALVRAIDAADLLAGRYPIRLVLVGDGPAFPALHARAKSVNTRWGREVISMPGADYDPRPAYAAADVVIGMGSSALRALALGRPVIVQGEKGFSETFGPETLDLFLQQGFYGLADAAPGAERLARQIDALLANAGRREALGQFGRQVVVERFSLKRAVALQIDIYREVVGKPSPRRWSEALRAGWLALALEIKNHDPRRQSARKAFQEFQLSAARGGIWPPPASHSHATPSPPA